MLDFLAINTYLRRMTIAPHESRSTASVNNQVGAEVRAWMGRLGFRQKHLAEVLDVSQTAISQRLNGKVPFGIDELQIIATWFGITLGDLLGSGVLNTKNPRPHVEDGDSGAKLLLLDLNQQPFDYWSGMLRSYTLAYALVSAAAASVPSSSTDERTGS
jgi:transcriptional regulator with XRE-family HTH domain